MDFPTKISYHLNGRVAHEEWRYMGFLDRRAGPALISYFENGQVSERRWHVYGQLERRCGPARIVNRPDGRISLEEWFVGDRLHNWNGPASILYKEDGTGLQDEWYLDGRFIDSSRPHLFISTWIKLARRKVPDAARRKLMRDFGLTDEEVKRIIAMVKSTNMLA